MEKFTYDLQGDETFNNTVENIFDMQQFAGETYTFTINKIFTESGTETMTEQASATIKAQLPSDTSADVTWESNVIKVSGASFADLQALASATSVYTDGSNAKTGAYRIILTSDTTIPANQTLTVAGMLSVESDITLTVSNGAKITQPSSATYASQIIQIANAVSLTIDGEGSIEAGNSMKDSGGYETGSAAVAVFNTAKLTVKGSVTLSSTNHVAISGGNHDASTGISITIGTGEDSPTIKSANSIGIFSPGSGTLTVNSGKITGGKTGIDFRDGTLNVYGGEISGGTGTPAFEGVNEYTNTYTNTGVAVAPSKNKSAAVNINGGTISGGYAYYTYGMNSSDNNDGLSSTGTASTVLGGTFVMSASAGASLPTANYGQYVYTGTSANDGVTVIVSSDNTVTSATVTGLDAKETVAASLTASDPKWNFIGYGSSAGVDLQKDYTTVTISGTAAASINSGATTIVGASTGTVAGLGDSAAATVSNGAISAIGSLNASGYWALGTATTGAVSNRTWTFSATDATLSNTSNAASVADKVDVKSGDITLSGGTGKANWTLSGNNSYGAKFDGSAYTGTTLTAASDGYVYARANTDATVTGSNTENNGGIVNLAKSAGVTMSGGFITAVDSLAASGGWTLGGSKVASVGSQVWTFSNEGATLANSATKAGLGTKAEFSAGGLMTLSGAANWSVDGTGATSDKVTAEFDKDSYAKATLTATSGDVIAQTDSDATVVGSAGGTVAGLAAGAKVTVTGGTAKGIDAFAVSGYWAVNTTSTMKVGSNQSWILSTTAKNATIGNETSATAAGANRITFASSGAATLTTGTTDLNWTVSGGASGGTALFDSLYTSATVGASKGTGGEETISASKDVTISGGVSGLVAGLASEGTGATVSNGIISEVSSLAAGGYWAVGSSKSAALGSQVWSFGGSSANATLTNGGNEPGAATKVDFVGNKAATVSGLTFSEDNSFTANGVEWSSIGGASNAFVFDTAGNVSLGASASQTAVVVTGAEGANVSVKTASLSNNNSDTTVHANGATLNVVNDDSFTLTLDESESGISGITGLKAGATLSATNDSMFGVGTGNTLAGYVVNNGNVEDATIKVAFSDTKTLQVYGVTTNDNYGGTNLTNGTVVYNLSAAKGEDPTAVTLGADSVNLSIVNNNGSDADVKVTTYGAADITSIEGVKVGDAVNSGDSEMTIVFTTGTALTNATSDTAAVITANDIKVSLTSAGQVTGSDVTVVMISNNDGVADTADKATIAGLAGTVSAGAGTYTWKGKNGTGVITEASGILYLDGKNLIAMDQSAVEAASAAEAAKDSLASAGTGSEALDAYTVYMGGGAPLSKAMSTATTNTSVVGFTDGSTVSGSVSTEASVASGVNIYSDSDTSLGKATKVTLQVVGDNMSSALNLSTADKPGSVTVQSAVIDLTGSAVNTMILGAASNATNNVKHTILGANVQSTIMLGDNATGANEVYAGTAGAYMLHSNSAAKASLIGSAGSDTITAVKGDYVFGGAGADVFYDGDIQIQDYNQSEGDVIVAQKLGTAGIQLSQIAIKKNTLALNAGGTITLGSAADADVYAAVVTGNDGVTTLANVLWTGASGTTLTATDYFKNGAIINANADTTAAAGDYVVGTSAADTIVVGVADTILAGAGNDSIIVDTNIKSAGAMIQLAAGKNTVQGWRYGFNYESGGSNILYAKASSLNFKSGTDYAVVYSGKNSLTFADTGESGAYNIVTRSGSTYTNMTFIKNGGTATVTSSDSLSSYYIGEGKNASLTFTSGVEDLGKVDMDSATLTGINYLDVSNNGKATIFGSDSAETVKVSGETRKYASLGAGNDYIISGTGAGNTFYFGKSDGNDTISGFKFWAGSDTDSDKEYADIINVNASALSSVKRSTKGVELTVGSTRVIVEDDSTSNAENNMILLKGGKAIKVGATSGSTQNNFTFDDNVTAYYGNTSQKKDTLTYGAEATTTKVYLTSSVFTNSGIKDVDASEATSSLRIYGTKSTDNVIKGGTNTTTMWGRSGNNTLIGGSGNDRFAVYGSGSNNTITGYGEGGSDYVWLYKGKLSNIASKEIDTENRTVSMTLKNGSTLTVTDIASGVTDVNFRVGSTYYHANLETGKFSKGQA